MNKGIIVIYNNNFGPESKYGVWCDKNMNNIWLSRDRKKYPHLDLKRRKILDILDNDRPDEIGLKKDLISRLK